MAYVPRGDPLKFVWPMLPGLPGSGFLKGASHMLKSSPGMFG